MRYITRSFKGTTWDEHKYIRIENGKYIYPEDLENQQATGSVQNIPSQNTSTKTNNPFKSAAKMLASTVKNIKQTPVKAFNNIKTNINAIIESAKNISIADSIDKIKPGGFLESTLNGIEKKKEENKKSAAGKIFNHLVGLVTPTYFKNIKNRALKKEDKDNEPFSQNDAKDSFVENRELHTNLKKKTVASSRDEDMNAVNRGFNREFGGDTSKAEAELNRLFKEYQDAYAASPNSPEAEQKWDEYNEFYSKYAEYFINCTSCTLTYDLRRRGYDAYAPKNSSDGAGLLNSHAKEFYNIKDEDVHYIKGTTERRWKSNKQTFLAVRQNDIDALNKDMLDSYPEGSYGQFLMQWASEDDNGGGHSIVWSIEDGEVILRDCQHGFKDTLQNYVFNHNIKEIEYFRTDDKELSEMAYSHVALGDSNKYYKNDDKKKTSLRYKLDKVYTGLTSKEKFTNKRNNSKRKDISVSRSFKGTTWDDHKYIRIENGRYIYEDDVQGRRVKVSDVKPGVNSSPKVKTFVKSFKNIPISNIQTSGATLDMALSKAGSESIYNTTQNRKEGGFLDAAIKGIRNAAKSLSHLTENLVRLILPDRLHNDINKALKKEDKDNVPFSQNDAEDSFKENREIHTELPRMTTTHTRDEDMMAVNARLFGEGEESAKKKQQIQDEYIDIINKYSEALANGDKDLAEKYYDEAIDSAYVKYYQYFNNCVNCTLAYDLRRRGYDVKAPGNTQEGGTYVASEGMNWYKMKDEDTNFLISPNISYNINTGNVSLGGMMQNEIDAVRDHILENHPEGSYGHFSLTWTDGGGHDVVWSIEDGEVILRDCQNGKKQQLEDVLQRSMSVVWWRADDKELTQMAYDYAKQYSIDYYKTTREYKRKYKKTVESNTFIPSN